MPSPSAVPKNSKTKIQGDCTNNEIKVSKMNHKSRSRIKNTTNEYGVLKASNASKTHDADTKPLTWVEEQKAR